MSWSLLIIGGYLLGSVPFGVLIARARGVDIRAHGSGNIGATNVGRVLGTRLGVFCFALDLCKGAIPVLVAGSTHGLLGQWAVNIPPATFWLWIVVGLAPLLGHMASIFLGFRGGKGVATAFGAMLAMWPTLGIPALIAFAIWLLVMSVTRIVSLASMIAAVMVPAATIVLLLSTPPPEGLSTTELSARILPPITVSLVVAALVLWRHRVNYRRLCRGEEPRFGQP
ncbi:MAG: glycerol-3-phosphate 1-O-acyltransferase PlsY [Phycisphaerales bacterium]|jgi:glycerol-3-phosphate acyltransferase PlsY|nr:glycerol-3-phosphate 1-O-acyltransferase PlsY [Phycisphaerales bacterium]MDP6890139.1 glycerol-3-phosphate 1-O-acyltransferase PlsY [Phycisphaerales bacterium]